MITVKFYGSAFFDQETEVDLPANSTLDDIQEALNEWLLEWIYNSDFEVIGAEDEERVYKNSGYDNFKSTQREKNADHDNDNNGNHKVVFKD